MSLSWRQIPDKVLIGWAVKSLQWSITCYYHHQPCKLCLLVFQEFCELIPAQLLALLAVSSDVCFFFNPFSNLTTIKPILPKTLLLNFSLSLNEICLSWGLTFGTRAATHLWSWTWTAETWNRAKEMASAIRDPNRERAPNSLFSGFFLFVFLFSRTTFFSFSWLKSSSW